jgi:hypothetical protein
MGTVEKQGLVINAKRCWQLACPVKGYEQKCNQKPVKIEISQRIPGAPARLSRGN